MKRQVLQISLAMLHINSNLSIFADMNYGTLIKTHLKTIYSLMFISHRKKTKIIMWRPKEIYVFSYGYMSEYVFVCGCGYYAKSYIRIYIWLEGDLWFIFVLVFLSLMMTSSPNSDAVLQSQHTVNEVQIIKKKELRKRDGRPNKLWHQYAQINTLSHIYETHHFVCRLIYDQTLFF